ncbi:MAG: phytanoyl-CoA dioxygenase family protein [Planctomycetota bacterium]|nr:MAG: phytanoyl-CoA dioxygenase family protein [Planctomycetota bacterium]
MNNSEYLKSKHEMVGDLFTMMSSAVEYDQYKLSEKDISFYHEKGYLPNHKILNKIQLDALEDGLENNLRKLFEDRSNDLIIDPELSTNKRLIYFQGGWCNDANFHDLIFHPAITVPVSQLLNTDKVRFWHDQCFYKPSHDGADVSWHQDYSYWQRTTPSNHITVWLSVDDSTLENGCLHVVPGSHKWGLLPEVELTSGSIDALKEYIPQKHLESFKPEPIELKAGYCSFHNDHMIHGSYQNNSDKPRRAIVLNFMGAGTTCNDDTKPIMPGFPKIPVGQVIEGDIFPIVFDHNKLIKN